MVVELGCGCFMYFSILEFWVLVGLFFIGFGFFGEFFKDFMDFKFFVGLIIFFLKFLVFILVFFSFILFNLCVLLVSYYCVVRISWVLLLF